VQSRFGSGRGGWNSAESNLVNLDQVGLGRIRLVQVSLFQDKLVHFGCLVSWVVKSG
jgi:hypothetical protein